MHAMNFKKYFACIDIPEIYLVIIYLHLLYTVKVDVGPIQEITAGKTLN